MRSACRAFERSGARVELTSDFETARRASGLVVPGVGAFSACMQGLKAARGDEIIRERASEGKSVFGICVGHQILFDGSDEGGSWTSGLGLIPGRIEQVPARILPHMGWNSVLPGPQSSVFEPASGQIEPAGFESALNAQSFYFVHSFAALTTPAPSWRAETDAAEFVAAVRQGSLFGTQFHPEKSGEAGLELIKRWVDEL